jgi:hypothetical protein
MSIKVREFANYCNDFYGVGGIYADELGGGVDYEAIHHAAHVVQLLSPLWGDGDSFDRELVRKVLTVVRGGNKGE